MFISKSRYVREYGKRGKLSKSEVVYTFDLPDGRVERTTESIWNASGLPVRYFDPLPIADDKPKFRLTHGL